MRSSVLSLADLAGRMAAIEERFRAPYRAMGVSTGWPGVDRALGYEEGRGGGLAIGAVHEWFGMMGRGGAGGRGGSGGGGWIPPVDLMIHLSRRALDRAWGRALRGAGVGERVSLQIVWIGERCWPYPPGLAGRAGGASPSILDHTLLVCASTRDERVWAADLALRSASVAAVVMDASGLGMCESRRLLLAAAEGGSIGLLARPPDDMAELSAAATRWVVAPHVEGNANSNSNGDVHRVEGESRWGPAWSIELRRLKGTRAVVSEGRLVGNGAGVGVGDDVDGVGMEDARRWVVRLDHETGTVHLVCGSGDRSAAAAGASSRRSA